MASDQIAGSLRDLVPSRIAIDQVERTFGYAGVPVVAEANRRSRAAKKAT
jgi:hypothetical protein